MGNPATATHSIGERPAPNPTLEPRPHRKPSKLALRVAVVRAGRVVDDVTLAHPASLTIGPSERDTIVVPPTEIASTVELIRHTSRGYIVAIPRGSRGVLAAASEKTASEKIELAHNPQGTLLREGSRGRIETCGITVLFQVIQAPTKPSPQALPASLKRGLDIDWATTVIAAFSFLLHFGLVGSIYSDWLDPLIDDQIVVGNVIESIASLPTAPPVEQGHEVTQKSATEPAHAKSTEHARGPTSAHAPTASHQAPSMSDAKAAAIARQLEELDAVVASTLRGGGPAVDEVLDRNSVLANLDALASADVKSAHGSALHFGGMGDGVARSDGLRDLAHLGDGEHTVDGGHAAAPKPAPNGRVDMTTNAPEAFPDAPRVIGSLQGRFHRCYQKGLSSEDPTMRGSMRLTLKIAPNGEVAGTSATSGGSLSATVVSCVQNVAAGAHFQPAPGGLGGTLVVPMGFQVQP